MVYMVDLDDYYNLCKLCIRNNSFFYFTFWVKERTGGGWKKMFWDVQTNILVWDTVHVFFFRSYDNSFATVSRNVIIFLHQNSSKFLLLNQILLTWAYLFDTIFQVKGPCLSLRRHKEKLQTLLVPPFGVLIQPGFIVIIYSISTQLIALLEVKTFPKLPITFPASLIPGIQPLPPTAPLLGYDPDHVPHIRQGTSPLPGRDGCTCGSPAP